MDYVHRCEFCGWSRDAGSAAMIEPACAQCGCGLRSLRRSELPAPELSDVERLDALLPRLDPSLRDALRIGFVALLIAAAARAGYAEGGAAIAVVAFGAVGLCTVPLVVPSRGR